MQALLKRNRAQKTTLFHFPQNKKMYKEGNKIYYVYLILEDTDKQGNLLHRS